MGGREGLLTVPATSQIPALGETVQFERDGRVAVVTIDRPAQRNAIDPKTSEDLNAAFVAIEEDPEIWISVLTGAGEVFCAGADLKAIAAGRQREITEAEPWGFGGLVRRGRRKPVIAAINGHALAGGLELVLACDLAVAAEGAQFGLPEVTRGIIAGAGGLWRLPQLIPPRRAMELILTGERIDAREAFRLGLVNNVISASEVLPSALALAAQVCQNAPVAVRESRAIAADAPTLPDGEGWQRAAAAWTAVLASEDAREGPLAFAERRAPCWTGR
jgi:enoyl-CoA hydratase/carnithine racemase